MGFLYWLKGVLGIARRHRIEIFEVDLESATARKREMVYDAFYGRGGTLEHKMKEYRNFSGG